MPLTSRGRANALVGEPGNFRGKFIFGCRRLAAAVALFVRWLVCRAVDCTAGETARYADKIQGAAWNIIRFCDEFSAKLSTLFLMHLLLLYAIAFWQWRWRQRTPAERTITSSDDIRPMLMHRTGIDAVGHAVDMPAGIDKPRQGRQTGGWQSNQRIRTFHARSGLHTKRDLRVVANPTRRAAQNCTVQYSYG